MSRANRIQALLKQLTVLDAADGGAFPYADCRRLVERSDRYVSLIADLDVYIAELAAYRRWTGEVQDWPEAKVEEVRRRLRSPFFERFPHYAAVRAEMTAADVPALRWALDVAEGTRLILLELLADLRRKPGTII